jgi:hypothetical protein
MFGWKKTEGDGVYSRLTPVLRFCERRISVVEGPSLGRGYEVSRQEDGLGSACADAGRHSYACDSRIHFLLAFDLAGQSLHSLSPGGCQWASTVAITGTKMKRDDYVRLAEKCARDADRMAPGPERDELLKKAKLFESYGKTENWISSPGLQPPN